MAKKKKEVWAGDLVIGSLVLCDDGKTREVEKVDPVIDPRGGIYLGSFYQEWWVKYTDGHQAIVSGSLQAA